MTWNKKMPANPVVAVAGATGAVGQEFMNVLHDLDFPASEVRALASARSAGKKIEFKGCGQVPAGELTVQEMTPEAFEGVDPIKRVVVSSYQAASGAGAPAMAELYDQTQEFLDGKRGDELTISAFAHQIAFNCIPHIDVFLEDGSTKEEWKMVVETKKIFHADIAVAPTCVRVPSLRCHAESVDVDFAEPITVEQAREALEAFDGVTVMDDPDNKVYPMPGMLEGTNDVYVGRLRKDPTIENGLQFWCVGDQIRKGAALNAVQIAKLLLP